MNLKYLFWCVILFILVHFVCYFFNIDLFELFEKKQPVVVTPTVITKTETGNGTSVESESETIHQNITSLTESLEQLKEITNN